MAVFMLWHQSEYSEHLTSALAIIRLLQTSVSGAGFEISEDDVCIYIYDYVLVISLHIGCLLLYFFIVHIRWN